MADERKTALVAMSGGVDSSVAAALMKEKGYDAIGVTMKLYDNGDIGVPREHSCCSLSDVEDARSVAHRLGMKYYVFNFADEFAEKVMDKFVSVYENGGTPNPCIDCNRYLKFDKLYRRAKLLGCDTLVTGHYARIAYDENSGRYRLQKAVNAKKDQSYVLYFLTQEQLAATQFPLGEFADKEEVRAIAERYGFYNAEKPDSQDICFVQNGDYADFIRMRTGKDYPAGDFVDPDGNVLGHHKGLIHYTVGQRKGLGLALPAPMYVCEKDTARNRVVLTTGKELYRSGLIVTDFNWIEEKPEKPIAVSVRTRYHAKEAAAEATVLPDGSVRIHFEEPQRAPTVGQAAVLYDGENVIGGGTIVSVL